MHAGRISLRVFAIVAGAAVVAAVIPVSGRNVTPAASGVTSGPQRRAGRLERPLIPPSGFIGYLASPRARALRRGATHPILRALAERLGETSPSIPQERRAVTTASVVPADAGSTAVTAGCGGAFGTRFNLEPRSAPAVAPQNGEALDFLPGAGLNGADLVVGSANDVRGLFGGLGDSLTGYYVHRSDASSNPCAVDFDGGLPSFRSRAGGELLSGDGDSALEADPARGAVFVADTRMGLGVSSIGLFRNAAARLASATACPPGTHDGPAASTCWPEHAEVNPRADGALNVFPHLAVDARPAASGPGAGDVYVTNTLSTPAGVFTVLTACTNSLSACSQTPIISGSDLRTQAAHVRVRPDGGVTVTYVNIAEGPAPDFLQLYDIKYVTCTPLGAPRAPSCSAPKLIVREDQPVPSTGGGLGGGSLAAANFQVTTHPKHEHRIDGNGVETYLVWERCKVQNIHGGDTCPDADVRLAASTDNGARWSFGDVDTDAGDQYFPAIRTDTSNVVTVAYFSAQGDAGLNHRARVTLRQIPPGTGTPDAVSAPVVITTLPMDPSADFFFGDGYIGSYIGLAARSTATGRHAYIHYTHTAVNGSYNGVPAPEQNNHLSRFEY